MCATVCCSCGAKLPATAFDAQLAAALRDAHRARAARHRQRRLEGAPGEVDAVRRQLRDPMRHDRAREVDRLASWPFQWYFADGGHG